MTTIGMDEMTGEQLALPSSERVRAHSQHGPVVGGRVKNGCQVFLNVPYALDVERWEDPKPLPSTYRYPEKEYIVDGKYCAQPGREYTAHIPIRQRLGLGDPTENPFFADIYAPSDVPFERVSPASTPSVNGTEVPNGNGSVHTRGRPVRVFIHGGFLQFGSTSGSNYNQQFFAAEHFGEVRVLLGHRLSVLGFLASDNPAIPGNFGFKDVWAGLLWVQANIASFGGDPAQVHLSGLSGGAHIVHQLLHHAARTGQAPFLTATLQSNAILTDPLTPADRRRQFDELCAVLGISLDGPGARAKALTRLRDRDLTPTAALIAAVGKMGAASTFRGVIEPGWVDADQMRFQASGELARGLAAAGVRAVIVGDVRDEAHFYAGCHVCPTPHDLLPNVARYYPLETAERLIASYSPMADISAPAKSSIAGIASTPLDSPSVAEEPAPSFADGAGAVADEEAEKTRAASQARLGRILADGQVYLPVRLLARDLASAGLPAVRYTIERVVRALNTNGSVSHGSDLPIQHLRLSAMEPEEVKAALEWHAAVRGAVEPALCGDGSTFVQRPEDQVLLMDERGTSWRHDWRWERLRAAEGAVRPEGRAMAHM